MKLNYVKDFYITLTLESMLTGLSIIVEQLL